MISISKYFDIGDRYQNYIFSENFLLSVLTGFWATFPSVNLVSRNIAIFVVRGAYLGHFSNGKFLQVAEISVPVEISTLHIKRKKSSNRVSSFPQKSFLFDAISKTWSNFKLPPFFSSSQYRRGGRL